MVKRFIRIGKKHRKITASRLRLAVLFQLPFPSIAESRDHFVLQFTGQVHKMGRYAPQPDNQVLVFFRLNLRQLQLIYVQNIGLMLKAASFEISGEQVLKHLDAVVSFEY